MAIKVDGSTVANTLGYFAFKKRWKKRFYEAPKKVSLPWSDKTTIF